MYERSDLRLLRGRLDRELPVADVAPPGPTHSRGGRPRPRHRRRQPGRPGASRRGLPRTRRAAGFRRRDVRHLRTDARAVPMRRSRGIFRERTMPTEINREELRTMAAIGAQLVETLPVGQYEEERLPGAINIPLKNLDSRTAATLDHNRPVIVYCYDYQ